MKDEVIGDDAPLCLVCKVALIKAAPGYANLLMSPSVAIRRFETVIGTHGFAAAKTGRVKREREAWISAVWALGLREITGKEYWIEIETRNRTPDCKVHFIDQSAGYNHVMTHNLEIVEWDEHRPEVVEVIAQKCGNAYPQYFSLLVFARNGKQIDVHDVSRQVKGLLVPFGEIWVLGRLPGSSAKYIMFTVHGGPRAIEFDLAEAIRKSSPQVDFLRRQKRGKSTEMRNLGITYLPIP